MKALAQSVAAILADQHCDKARALSTTFTQCRDFLAANVVKLAPPNDPEDEEDETEEEQDDETGQLPPLVEQAIAALMTANPNLDRQVAADFLLHNRHGRQLLEDLSKQEKGLTMTTTDRATELQSICKQHGGIQAMAKLFVATGKSLGGVTEAEFTKLIDDAAQATRQPGERPGSAFNRYFNDAANLDLRKAHALTRGF